MSAHDLPPPIQGHPFDDPDFRSEASRRLREAPDALLPPHTLPPDRNPYCSVAETLQRERGLRPLRLDAPWLEAADPLDPPARLPAQVDFARSLILDGATEIEVRQKLAETFKEKAQPKKAFNRAFELVVQEQRDREPVLAELVMATRWRAIQGAIQAGSWGAAGAMLRDAGAVAGETSPARLDAGAAELTVTVEAETIQEAIQDDHSG